MTPLRRSLAAAIPVAEHEADLAADRGAVIWARVYRGDECRNRARRGTVQMDVIGETVPIMVYGYTDEAAS